MTKGLWGGAMGENSPTSLEKMAQTGKLLGFIS